jgi:hypothetical protein
MPRSGPLLAEAYVNPTPYLPTAGSAAAILFPKGVYTT